MALDHFSTQASSSDGLIGLPPILEQAQVDLNAGAATYSFPLKTAPGIGGLEPVLNLTYSSARIDESSSNSTAPWVGAGWDLSVPSITKSGDRFFLNLNGAGGELVKATDYATSFHWVTRDQHFLEITHNSSCDDDTGGLNTDDYQCAWSVRDQAGRAYLFGANLNSRRYYLASCGGLCLVFRHYQWDLASITDANGNAASYQYQQIVAGFHDLPSTVWVVSSYPLQISYPGGRVTFALRSEQAEGQWYDASNVKIKVRPDATMCNYVLDSRALDSVTAESWDGSGYQTSAAYVFHISSPAQSCTGPVSTLTSIDIHGRDNDATILASPSFDYVSPAAHLYTLQNFSCQTTTTTQAFARLSKIHSGFGGETDFNYGAEVAPSCPDYGRFTVASTVTKAGSSWSSVAPDVVTSFLYSDGPHYVQDGLQYVGGPAKIAYRGYRTARETRADGTYTTHTFLTGDENTTYPNELAGREVQTDLYGSETPAALWLRVVRSYSSVGANGSPTPSAFFNKLNSVTTTLKDTTASATTFTYNDADGTLTSTTTDGDTNAGNANVDCKVETTSYLTRHDTTLYLVVPRVEQVLPCGAPTATAAAETVFFYDGSNDVPPATPTPIRGNVTVVRRMVNAGAPITDPQKYVYGFNAYYQNGLLLNTSVAKYGSSTFSATTSYGSIPAGLGYTVTNYDAGSMPSGSSSGRFPATETVHVYNGTSPAAVPTQVTNITYDRELGLPIMSVAPNGLQSGTSYDQFGRVTDQWQAPDTSSSPGTHIAYYWSGGSQGGTNQTTIEHRMTLGSVGTVDEVHCMDGLGQELQTGKGVGTADISLRVLNTLGQVRSSQVEGDLDINWVGGCGPFPLSAPMNLTTYDPLGGVSIATTSGRDDPHTDCSPSCVHIDRNGRTTSTRDQLDHKKDSVVDGLGRVIRTIDYTGTTATGYTSYSQTDFAYDILGNLTMVRASVPQCTAAPPGCQHDTVMTYDALGRKNTMLDPDMSGGSTAWTYIYDAAGNLLTQTDARGAVTTMTYDSLNRVLSKTYGSASGVAATAAAAFTYDAYDSDPICTNPTPPDAAHPVASPVGKMTVMTDGSGSTRWCYDIRGREIKKRHVVADTPCATSRTLDTLHAYDSGNRMTSLTYPDGEEVDYGYNDFFEGGGTLATMSSSLGTYISAVSYHATGAPASITFGNGYTTTYGHDSRYRLSSISTSSGTSTAQNVTYGYDEKGNIKQINNLKGSDNVFYNYDDLDRITEMRQDNASTGTLLASYGYGSASDPLGGAIGNLMSNSESGRTFAYADAAHIHAPSSANGGAYSYTYDANGNMSAFVRMENYTFDGENRLVHTYQVTYGFQNDYVYDGAGNLARRRITSSMFSTVDQKNLYVDGIYEEASNACSAGRVTKYYVAFGRIVARREPNQPAPAYLLTDHLGSNVGAIYSSGTITTNKYYPFGTARGSSSNGDKAFTGQQKELTSSLNAYYYHARFYSPDLGHFMSADSKAVDGLNRYQYAVGNPLSYTDPSGECIKDCTPLQMIALIGCGLIGDCGWVRSVPSEAMQRLSRWVLRQSDFGDTVRQVAKVYSGFDGVVRGIRVSSGYTEESHMEMESALVTHFDPSNGIPTTSKASGKGLVTDYEFSYSYLDVMAAVGGQTERRHNSWINEFLGFHSPDLALQIHVSIDGHPFVGGSKDSGNGSHFSQEIDFEEFHSVEMYTSLEVKQTADVLRVDFMVRGEDWPLTTPVRSYETPN